MKRSAQSKSGKPLIDVRSPGEYRGEITHMPEYPQEGVLRGGHIPGAKSMPWKTATNDDATFKPASELAKIYFDQCGVSPDKRYSRLLPNRRALQSHLVCADLLVRPEQRPQLRRFVD